MRGALYNGGVDDNYAHRVPIEEVHASLARSKARSIALLGQAISSLRGRLDEAPVGDDRPISRSVTAENKKVFIVHGHDDGARESVARFLSLLGLPPVILHEQANKGRTIIEKIEAQGNVGFAVVLLTPDGVGKAKGAEHLQPRAARTSFLSSAYLSVGSADRVCVLKRGELKVPSDYAGVVYEPYDEGVGWRQTLARELEAAGYLVDWNK